jgi:hypothetical protein
MNKFKVVYAVTYLVLFAAVIAALAWYIMHHQIILLNTSK